MFSWSEVFKLSKLSFEFPLNRGLTGQAMSSRHPNWNFQFNCQFEHKGKLWANAMNGQECSKYAKSARRRASFEQTAHQAVERKCGIESALCGGTHKRAWLLNGKDKKASDPKAPSRYSMKLPTVEHNHVFFSFFFWLLIFLNSDFFLACLSSRMQRSAHVLLLSFRRF